MDLKFKFLMDGSTQLKSKAGKTSDDKLLIKFDTMYGNVAYDGGEICQFELCRLGGRFSSSRTLASCAVPAKKIFENGMATQVLTLGLEPLDTPGKVLANLTLHM